MKKFILGAVAAVVLGLGLTAADASAAWVIRPVQRWNPRFGAYVVVQERVWVPETVVAASPPVVTEAPVVTPVPIVTAAPVVVQPAPVVVAPPVRVVTPPIIVRPYYRHHFGWWR